MRVAQAALTHLLSFGHGLETYTARTLSSLFRSMLITKILRRPNLVAFFLALLAATNVCADDPTNKPERSSGNLAKELVHGKRTMVVTNNPWASKVADQILMQGGSATDAAIAAGFVLGLTEPQSSGIGGGGYAISLDNGKLIAYDGREAAPHSATPDMFIDADGQPMAFDTARFRAQAIGVPSEVALFRKMHQDSGKLPWVKLVEPAIQLAEQGFPMGSRLYTQLVAWQNTLGQNSAVAKVYFDLGGRVKPIGTLVKNLDYAKTLKIIAANPDDLYDGKLAKAIIHQINSFANKELYIESDLSGYQVKTCQPVCVQYRDIYTICSVPPSTGGGVAVLELMQLYADGYLSTNVKDPRWAFRFLQASKLAFADRNQYLADPQYVPQPVAGLLDAKYINMRSALITDRALPTPVLPGKPSGIKEEYASDKSFNPHGTTSLAIIDSDGRAISMTLSVEHEFGTHFFFGGFFLNNQLTDFSFTPTSADGKLIANRVEPGKRPRSSIAPTMAFDQSGDLRAVVGSPGGGYIICYVAKNLIQMLDMELNALQAASSPNLCAVNSSATIEIGESWLSNQIPYLVSHGEKVLSTEMVSGEVNILRTQDGWVGSADPRREGLAIGR